MKPKKIIWLIIVLVVAAVAWYAYREYTRTHKDLHTLQPDFTITAAGLTEEYEKGETAAASKFNDMIVEVSGRIKKTEKDEKGDYTVVLDGKGTSSVRCLVDTPYRKDAAILQAGTSAVVRGVCTGFIRDDMGLGSDVILNRCVIIKKE